VAATSISSKSRDPRPLQHLRLAHTLLSEISLGRKSPTRIRIDHPNSVFLYPFLSSTWNSSGTHHSTDFPNPIMISI
jgi:hypothetical protein